MLRINLLLTILLIALVSKAEITAVFNWASPTTLTPAYAAPTSSNRNGDHVSNVEFSSNGVGLVINDDKVLEWADKARFVYNIYTESAELRSNLYSVIEITAPDNMDISQVLFEGAKADENYISAAANAGTFKKGSWTAEAAERVATFELKSTINCSKITVICTQHSGVEDIAVDYDANSPTEVWYTLQGGKLTQRPTQAGVYLKQTNKTVKKVLIR